MRRVWLVFAIDWFACRGDCGRILGVVRALRLRYSLTTCWSRSALVELAGESTARVSLMPTIVRT